MGIFHSYAKFCFFLAHVCLYLHTFYNYNNLMLHYELNFLGFLHPMPLEKTTLEILLDWSQKIPFLILKVLFISK